ncbi:MAG: hypothetical protein ACRD1V_17940 [Vicinamibacterales bacterium]
MPKSHGRPTKRAGGKTPAIDPKRAELAALKRQRRTQRELNDEARRLARSVASADAAILQSLDAIAAQRGLIVVDAERHRALQARIDKLQIQIAQLPKPVDEPAGELVGEPA